MPRGQETKKGTKGIVANYITRTKAVKKLQISLKDFRYALPLSNLPICLFAIALRCDCVCPLWLLITCIVSICLFVAVYAF